MYKIKTALFSIVLWAMYYVAFIENSEFARNILLTFAAVYGFFSIFIVLLAHAVLFSDSFEDLEKVISKNRDEWGYNVFVNLSLISYLAFGAMLVGMGHIIVGSIWVCAVIGTRSVFWRVDGIQKLAEE